MSISGIAGPWTLPPGSVDLAITSPPYVNGMDYVMNYKLDLAWLGYARDYADLAELRHRMVACDNLPREEAARYARRKETPDPWLGTILSQIERNLIEKGTYRRQDVHGVVNRYFWDLVPVLKMVHGALRPGGRFSLVVGDSLLAGAYVPGDLLVARLGARVGFEIEGMTIGAHPAIGPAPELPVARIHRDATSTGPFLGRWVAARPVSTPVSVRGEGGVAATKPVCPPSCVRVRTHHDARRGPTHVHGAIARDRVRSRWDPGVERP